MMVLDTHIGYRWIDSDDDRLSKSQATTLEWDGQLASVDGQFPAYLDLAGRYVTSNRLGEALA